MRYITATLAYLLYTLPQTVGAAGLVPCGGTGQAPCQTCDLVVLSNNVLLWLFGILALIAGIVIIYAGFVMVTSRGDASLIQQAKGYLTNIFIGLIIVFSAWFIVDTIGEYMLDVDTSWNMLECVEQPEFRAGPLTPLEGVTVYGPGDVGGGAVNPGLCADNNLSPQQLVQAGCVVTNCSDDGSAVGGLSCAEQCAADGGTIISVVSTGGPAEYVCSKAPPRPSQCSIIESGPCTVDNLRSTFGDRAEEASRVCSVESGGLPIQSGSDRCCGTDGSCVGDPSFSGGIFQVNILSEQDRIERVTGINAGDFYNRNGSTAQGECMARNANGICIGWTCEITDQAAYQQLINAVINTDTNLQISGDLFNQRGFQPWLNTARKCNVPF